MEKPLVVALLTAVALLACGAAAKKEPDKPPACMHCGATCGLEPICVCEPATKKRQKKEYATETEPVCVAGCGSKPWPFGRDHERAGCTGCCDEPCRCPGRVRACKRLRTETAHEEVATIERRVAYVCGPCAGKDPVGCCDDAPAHRTQDWWTRLLNWCRPW